MTDWATGWGLASERWRTGPLAGAHPQRGDGLGHRLGGSQARKSLQVAIPELLNRECLGSGPKDKRPKAPRPSTDVSHPVTTERGCALSQRGAGVAKHTASYLSGTPNYVCWLAFNSPKKFSSRQNRDSVLRPYSTQTETFYELGLARESDCADEGRHILSESPSHVPPVRSTNYFCFHHNQVSTKLSYNELSPHRDYHRKYLQQWT